MSIHSADEADQFDDQFDFPCRMCVTERLRFVALFVAAAALTVLVAMVVLPFAIFGLLKRGVASRIR